MVWKGKYWWILVVVFIVLLLVVGGLFYVKKNKWKRDEGLVRRVESLEPKEMWVRASWWDDKELRFSFWDEVSGDTGVIIIDFRQTVVSVGVVDNERGEVRQELLASMMSAYFEKAFCPWDYVLLTLTDKAYLSKKQVSEFVGGDVEKITNFGPSRCRI